MQCTYKRNIKARSRNHFCGGEKSNKCYIFWLCACSRWYPSRNAHAPYCHLCPDPLYSIFPHYLTNGTIFGGEMLLNTKFRNTKIYWTQNVTEHKKLLNTKSYWTQNVTEHKMLLNTKCYWTQKLLNTKCYWTQNVTEHKMLLNTKVTEYKSYWTQNVTEHKMLLNTKCYWTEIVTEHKMCVLIFCTDFVWNISNSKKNSARYDQKCISVCM